jgi:hypothetical protein
MKIKENEEKNNKIIYLKNVFDNHMINCYTKEGENKKTIPSSLLDLSLKKCVDI